MKNSGLKNEAQVAKIFVSGSNALPQTNDTGVRLFKESAPAAKRNAHPAARWHFTNKLHGSS